jgi:hypothetical protein
MASSFASPEVLMPRKSSPAKTAVSVESVSIGTAGKAEGKGGRTGPSKAAIALAEWDRRSKIIEEHHLRQEVARLAALRNDDPRMWRDAEARRLASNREKTDFNRRLRAAGCHPVELEPSLRQKMKRLQCLEAVNVAKPATSKG